METASLVSSECALQEDVVSLWVLCVGCGVPNMLLPGDLESFFG